MKSWFKNFCGGLLGVLLASAALAQSQPVLSVSITQINVGGTVNNPVGPTWTGGTTFATPNESFGAAGTAVNIAALGVGTFTTGSYVYTFYVNGIAIGTSNTIAPPTNAIAQWTPPQPGAYFLTVTATDGGNSATSLPVRYFATGTQIIGPTNNTLVPNGSSVVIQAVATPPPSTGTNTAFVSRVDFYADAALIGSDTTYPYSIIYTPPTLPSAHTIEARAFDNNNVQISPNGTATETLNMVTPIGTPPSCSITSPTNGAAIAIGGTITVTVTSNSSTDRISKVEFYVDGILTGTNTVFPYNFSWTPTVVGTYKLVALAYDGKNNVVASTTGGGGVTPNPTSVTIASPPTVVVTRPTSGSTVVGGAPTQLTASAVDPGGSSITSVQFFVDTVFVGNGTLAAGSTTVWNTTATLTQKLDSSGNPIPSTVTALATTSSGLSGVSPGVSVNVTSGGGSTGGTTIGQPPTVSVTTPSAGAQLRVNTPITLTASASDPDGNIVSVQFLANGTSVANSTVYPYSATWTPTSLGNYSLTAKATDNDGNTTTSSAVTVSVIDPSTSAPTVSIAFPASGTTISVGATQRVTASASDSSSVASVQFFLNGLPLGNPVTTYPFETTWTPTSPGSFLLSAQATNATGTKTTSASVSVTVASVNPPTVSLTSPANGTSIIVNTPLSLNATASSAGASISSVQFFANGLSLGTSNAVPYSIAWTPTSAGTYTLKAVATDSFSQKTDSSTISVTVTAGSTSLPFVYLTGASSGTNVAVNTPVFVSANAGDPDGVVAGVEFYANGQLIGTKAASPYFAVWTPTTAGSYTISAIVTDDGGNRVTSSTATITAVSLSGSAPAVDLVFNDPTVDTPTPGATTTAKSPFTPVKVDYGSKIIAAVDAVSPSATITGVQFFANGTRIANLTAAPFYTIYQLNTLADVTITALVTDSAGNTVYTNPAIISTQPAADTASDNVTLVSPVNNSGYLVGGQITFSATHNFGTVNPPKIDFYLNGEQFTTVKTATGSGANSPYQFTIGLTRAGTYDVHAVLRLGNTTTVSNMARITVSSHSSPVVNITAPGGGGTYVVGTPVPIAASASSPDGIIQNVQFYLNGTSLSTKNTAPYTATLNPGSPGSYVITAIATDDAGNQTVSAPVRVTFGVNQPPAVALSAPTAGTTTSAGIPVNLVANASDTDGTVASVAFLANGNLVGTATAAPFLVSWTPSAGGSYSIVAQATDNSGNVTNSAPITVTVSAHPAPTVTLTAPVNGVVVLTGSSTQLTATASSADGTIKSVQFFANGTAIGTAVTAVPYRATWTPTAEGVYRLTAVALDNANATATSATVTVMAVSATTGGADSVYTGNYQSASEVGNFALVNVRGKSAAFIGYSTIGGNKTYFYAGLPIDSGGGFNLLDGSGRALISGATNASGVSGSLDNGRMTFIGVDSSFFPATAAVAAGYYTGNLTGRAASTLAAIVGSDGSIFVYAADTSLIAAGSGRVDSAGNFSIAANNGGRFTGKADPATGFLSGSLSGTGGGSFMGAIESGSAFSDGSLRNLSTRGQVGTGNNILIAGFVVGGTVPKQILVRAIGPSLSQFGLTGVLTDPQLSLFSGNNALVTSNNNWGGAPALVNASNQVGAFSLTTTSLDAVVVATLAPGAYTAQVSGVNGGTGVALVELYDVDSVSPFSAQKVMNVSTRGVVGTGANLLVAGFVVSGNTPKKVLIRGVGPTLAAAPFNVTGTLADPVLRLVRNSDGLVVRENDNWETGNDTALVSDAAVRVGAFPLAAGGKDAAIVINLPPGSYSAQVSGVNSTTGVALVEVYEVPQ